MKKMLRRLSLPLFLALAAALPARPAKAQVVVYHPFYRPWVYRPVVVAPPIYRPMVVGPVYHPWVYRPVYRPVYREWDR